MNRNLNLNYLTLNLTLALLTNILIVNSLFAKDKGLEQCESLMEKGNYTQALVSVKGTRNVDGLLCQGRAQIALQHTVQAQTSFEQALALKPQDLSLASVHMLLGNALIAQNQLAQAVAQYEQAAKVSEQAKVKRYVMIAHQLKGEAYASQGQHQQALEAYQASEKLAMNDNERADCFAHLASAYEGLKQLDKAIEFQLKSVLMQKKAGTLDQYAEASLVLGQLFHADKDFAGADKTFQRLWQFAKDNGGEYYVAKTNVYWAKTKAALGDNSASEKLLAEAKQLAQQLQANDVLDLMSSTKP